ncbi:hypothetical protein [uncultured Roseobacter sp.]|uniref:hypothetical protein n=1 Tax=uncultured Roseobacter sp. TaxID=114847 RepID=UPI002623939E|nr:hypothetical protein [uncultured Roseobacter sp.]
MMLWNGPSRIDPLPRSRWVWVKPQAQSGDHGPSCSNDLENLPHLDRLHCSIGSAERYRLSTGGYGKSLLGGHFCGEADDR